MLTAKEKLQALKSGPGSMLAYNQLREREKSQIEKEIPEGESGTQQMMAESGNFFFQLVQLAHFNHVNCIMTN